MRISEPPTFFLNADVVWIEGGVHTPDSSDARSEFTIGELAEEFGITPRALRFYEARGLLSPARSERMRVYDSADRERIALILKAKKFGFTLVEIKEMIDAQTGGATVQALKLSRRKCSEQIDLLQRQKADVEEALAELQRIHTLLSGSGTAHELA